MISKKIVLLILKIAPYIFVIIILVCLLAKLYYFIFSGRRNFFKYVKSFLRYYMLYDIGEAPPDQDLFMEMSNRINLIFWISLVLMVMIEFVKKYMKSHYS